MLQVALLVCFVFQQIIFHTLLFFFFADIGPIHKFKESDILKFDKQTAWEPVYFSGFSFKLVLKCLQIPQVLITKSPTVTSVPTTKPQTRKCFL